MLDIDKISLKLNLHEAGHCRHADCFFFSWSIENIALVLREKVYLIKKLVTPYLTVRHIQWSQFFVIMFTVLWKKFSLAFFKQSKNTYSLKFGRFNACWWYTSHERQVAGNTFKQPTFVVFFVAISLTPDALWMNGLEKPASTDALRFFGSHRFDLAHHCVCLDGLSPHFKWVISHDSRT